MKILIVYYSKNGEQWVGDGLQNIKDGNTKVLCQKIKDFLDCDAFEIEPTKVYPDGYRDCCEVAKIELSEKALPELKALPQSISQYDAIILAYPCWWGTYPRCVATFLSKFDFSKKIILPICTHEGSEMGNSEIDLKKALPDADVRDGLPIRGSEVRTSLPLVEKWLVANKII